MALSSQRQVSAKIITQVSGPFQIQIRCQIINRSWQVHYTDPIPDQTTGQRTDHRPNHIMVSGHITRHRSLDKLEDRSQRGHRGRSVDILYLRIQDRWTGTCTRQWEPRLKNDTGNETGKVDGPRCEKTLIQKRAMLVHSGELGFLYRRQNMNLLWGSWPADKENILTLSRYFSVENLQKKKGDCSAAACLQTWIQCCRQTAAPVNRNSWVRHLEDSIFHLTKKEKSALYLIFFLRRPELFCSYPLRKISAKSSLSACLPPLKG